MEGFWFLLEGTLDAYTGLAIFLEETQSSKIVSRGNCAPLRSSQFINEGI